MSYLPKSQSMTNLEKPSGELEFNQGVIKDQKAEMQVKLPPLVPNNGGSNTPGKYDISKIKPHDGTTNVIQPQASHRHHSARLMNSPSAPNLPHAPQASQISYQGQGTPQNYDAQQHEQILTHQFESLLSRKQELANELARRKKEKIEDRKKDELYSQVKDSIEKEIEERNQEKQDK